MGLEATKQGEISVWLEFLNHRPTAGACGLTLGFYFMIQVHKPAADGFCRRDYRDYVSLSDRGAQYLIYDIYPHDVACQPPLFIRKSPFSFPPWNVFVCVYL